MPATDANRKRLEVETKKQQIQETKEEKDAFGVKADLEKLSLSIFRKAGEGDVLFGSVTSADIAALLENEGYAFDKRKIELDEPIKRLGDYQVPVKLHKSVIAEVKLSVVKE